MNRYFVVVYDIEKNRARKRISNELNAWGNRVQKSVFEICIKLSEYESLKKKILSFMDKNDSCRFYLKDTYRNSFLGENEIEFVIRDYEIN